MSGMVECYLINDAGEQCDFTPAVTNTRVIFGKNQPFLCVEITVSKYLFDSKEFWGGQTQEGQETLTRPKLIQNTTPIHIKTYGGEYDLIYTQTLNPDDMTYVFLCYSKMWQAKTTKVTSLISQDIVWNGQSDSYSTGNLTISCNGFTTTSKVGGTFTPQNGNGDSVKNVQIINASTPIDLKSVRHFRQPWRDYKEVSNITVGTLRVLVPIYRDESIPPIEGQGGTDELPDFHDLNGTMRADTVYASIIFDYTCPLSAQDNAMYYEAGRKSITQAVTHPSNYVQQNVEGQMVTSSTTEDDGVLYCKGIEYICGFGQTLFAWMANKIGGYTGSQLTIDQGYLIETSENILAKLDYTSAELQAYKNKTVEERIHGDTIFKIQPDILANDLITTVANATNRHAFFADTPYLASFEISGDDALSQLNIQYTVKNGAYCAYFIPLGETEPQQIVLGSGVQYDDQGSTYLVGQQTARSPNTSVTVSVTDAGTDISGMPIEVNLNTESIESNKGVLAQIAFNRLVQNYHPSNTLSFIALENTSTQIDTDYVAYMKSGTGFPEPSAVYVGRYYVNAGEDDVNLYSCQLVGGEYSWVASVTPVENDTVTVHAPSNTYFFRFLNGAWVQFSYIVTVDRHELFRPDTRCAVLEDVRSHTTLINVPLAYTVLSWPDCSTRYMFGEPIFQDTETTIAELQSIAKQTVTNTSVSEALNKPYVATAIGNMSLDEAGDDLTDFTGIILQKNESTGVASMDGYAGGQRQARFSSDGSISSGVVTYHSPRSSDPTALTEAGDSVIMDRNGFHTRSWHLYPYTAPEYAYTDGYWIEEASIGVDGMISAGAGSVTLGADGLVNYDSEGEPAYTLDDEGLKYKGQPIINTENGKIQLKVDGAAIDGNLRAVSITLPYVQIDNEGLRTFDRYFWDTEKEEYQYLTTDLQCSVGTNGVITAGAGAVKLDQYGLSTWTGVVASDILGGWDYSNATRQCAVTTSGELIAGANLYKLDVNGLSFNKTPLNTTSPSWVRLLYYNQAENQIELPQDIHVTNATIDNLSADKITSGTLRATTAITCAGTIKAGSVVNGWSVLDNTGLKVYTKGIDPTTQQNPRSPAVWVDSDGYHMCAGATSAEQAEIKYGTWANHLSGSQDVRASVNLLSNVALNAGPVCAEYIDGIDDTIHYAVTLNDTGLRTYQYEYDEDDQHSGYVTNVQQNLQCSIDSDGNITAGGGAVELNAQGLTTYSAEFKNTWVQTTVISSSRVPTPQTQGNLYDMIIVPISLVPLDADYYVCLGQDGDDYIWVYVESMDMSGDPVPETSQECMLHKLWSKDGFFFCISSAKDVECRVSTDGEFIAGNETVGEYVLYKGGLKYYNSAMTTSVDVLVKAEDSSGSSRGVLSESFDPHYLYFRYGPSYITGALNLNATSSWTSFPDYAIPNSLIWANIEEGKEVIDRSYNHINDNALLVKRNYPCQISAKMYYKFTALTTQATSLHGGMVGLRIIVIHSDSSTEVLAQDIRQISVNNLGTTAVFTPQWNIIKNNIHSIEVSCDCAYCNVGDKFSIQYLTTDNIQVAQDNNPGFLGSTSSDPPLKLQITAP